RGADCTRHEGSRARHRRPDRRLFRLRSGMKYLARMLAIAGFVLAVALFVREDVGAIVDLVIAAGPGLVVAGLFHCFPMIANARAWQRLLPAPRRPGLRVLTWAIWVRESVNGLLPVA